MKFFLHVLYSWLLAIAIILTSLFIYWIMVSYASDGDTFEPGFLFIPFGALLVALPSLLAGLLFLLFIRCTNYTVIEKFLLWYIAAVFAVILNILFILFLFDTEIISADIFLMLWPVYAATILSLSIRHKQFIILFLESIKKEETTL